MTNYTQVLLNYLHTNINDDISLLNKNIADMKTHSEVLWRYGNELNDKLLERFKEVQHREREIEDRKALLATAMELEETQLKALEAQMYQLQKDNHEYHIQYKDLQELLGLNKNLQNESDFIATQDSILLSQIETELRSSIIKKSELESSINELNSILPKLSEEESLLENKLLDTNLELLNLESINHSLLKEIDQVKEDINAHELSIPKLLTTYNNVLKEFNEISKRRGINYLEKLEEIVKSKPELICIVCSSSEGGRMKKCLVCSAPVHAKCTRDLKFVCEICKSK